MERLPGPSEQGALTDLIDALFLLIADLGATFGATSEGALTATYPRKVREPPSERRIWHR